MRPVVALAAVLLALAGCSSDRPGEPSPTVGQSATPIASPQSNVTGSISAGDQTSDGKSVVVRSATITQVDGWVVIYADDGGKPGQTVLGTAWFPSGKSANLVVRLDRAVTSGVVWPTVHCDIGEPKVFEYPGVDIPVKTPEGTAAQADVTLTVAT